MATVSAVGTTRACNKLFYLKTVCFNDKLMQMAKLKCIYNAFRCPSVERLATPNWIKILQLIALFQDKKAVGLEFSCKGDKETFETRKLF